MNPLLIILIFLGGVLLWLLSAFAYRAIGGLFKKLFDDAKEAMSDENKTVKENYK